MKTRNTIFSNIFYLCDERGIIGIRMNPGEYQQDFYIGDTVNVTADAHGYICPGITTPGIGRITCVHEDDTDHFFTVEMENGEIGRAMKSNRLEVIRSSHNA